MFHDRKLHLPEKLRLNKTPGVNYWEALLNLPLDESCIAFRLQDSDENLRLAFKKFVCIVDIETSSYCNRSCHYCPARDPRYKRNTEQNLMPDQVWRRIVQDLETLGYSSTISLNLYNEAMADPTLESKIEEVKSRLPHCVVKFNSNGDFLDYKRIKRLEEAGLDAIFITLHPAAGASYDDDDRLRHLKQFFDRIRYEGPLDTFEKQVKIRSEFFFDSLRILVMCDNWGDLGTSRGGLIPELNASHRTLPCWRPIREFTISHQGHVYPCCQIFPDEEANFMYCLGNVLDSRLWEIYGSRSAVQWRRNLLPFSPKSSICKSCNDADNSCQTSQSKRLKLLRASEDVAAATGYLASEIGSSPTSSRS